MSFIHDERFDGIARHYQRQLKHRQVRPTAIIKIERDENGFQGYKTVKISDLVFPITLSAGDSVLFDFGEHCVGQLHYSFDHTSEEITDSPTMINFSLGEFPFEIEKRSDEYKGVLGNGWFQRETRHVAVTPHTHYLERRYSFRFLKIERLDNAGFPILLTELYADATSAVDLSDAPKLDIPDPLLKEIYDVSVNTLKECEQDVYEDGPKRDRRLWSGDLRLQALSDYYIFKNIDLIRRCIYLFAAHRYDHGFVAQCVFPESYPYVYKWIFYDYSLFFISFLYDYSMNYSTDEHIESLYPLALEQAQKVFAVAMMSPEDFSRDCFIDWCPGLDKGISSFGVLVYTLKQLRRVARRLGFETEDVEKMIAEASDVLLERYSAKSQLFVTKGGQISWHSQIWAALAGVLPKEENTRLLERMANANLEYYPHTPYMMHYYIEALYNCGEKEKAIDVIKDYWGKMVDFGYDTCFEVFNPENHFESPYNAPELNSSCHAWSCTPAYWIYRYYNE